MSTQHNDPGLEWDLLDRLHKSMRVRGIGSSELAAQLGIHRNTVSNYLSGRTPMDRRTLIAWAFATGVSVDWLQTGKDPHDGGPDGENGGLASGSSKSRLLRGRLMLAA